MHIGDRSAPARVAIIGGGITGLAAAHRLIELMASRDRTADQSPLTNHPSPLTTHHAPLPTGHSSPTTGHPFTTTATVTLFEASDRLGGAFGTRRIDGYTVETGADSFITSKPWAVELCGRLGLDDRLIGTDERFRRSLILKGGRPLPTPPGFELLVPRRLMPLLRSPLLSPAGKARVAAELLIPRRKDPSDESLAAFVRRRFGREALERIVQPLVGGIYTSDPERLSMAATLPRFVDMEREHGSLLRAVLRQRGENQRGEKTCRAPDTAGESTSGARYGLFATLAGGLSELITALEQRLRTGGTIHLSRPVTAVRPADAGRWIVQTAGSPDETFDAVILALPAFRAADLVSGWDRDLAARLRDIEYASSAIVVTGHRLADVAHPLDAFGLVIPHIEGRRILAVSFLSRKFPGRAPEGHVILRTFVGGAMQPEVLQQDDPALLQTVMEELRSIFGVRGEPAISLIARSERSMPQYHVGHLEQVAAIESAAAAHPTLQLAGNAFHGVGIPDCIHSGERAAEKLLDALCRAQQ